MGIGSFFEKIGVGTKALYTVPEHASDQATIGASQGLMKAYVSNKYLYKPPYGYPRDVDVDNLRLLARQPHVFIAIQTIIDEVASVEWDIVPKERDEPTGGEEQSGDDTAQEQHQGDKKSQLGRIKKVKEWFYNPNGNEESFEYLIRAITRDILELDSGVWVKAYNKAGKFVQMFARDGGTFLKNPDPFGYLGHRADYVKVPRLWSLYSDQEKVQVYETIYNQNAAYFQYGAIGMMPVPFGKKEVVYVTRNPRTDSIYGRSPVEILQDLILTLFYGAKYNTEFYTNNNMPEGIIQLMGAQKDQIASFRERMQKQYMTKDVWGNFRKAFHKIPIINTEAKFTPFQINPKEMEIIAQQQWFSKLVWACFGVTPSELGFTEDSNRSTEISQSKVFKRKAIKPILKTLEYHINTQIMPEFNAPDVEFRFIEYDLTEDVERHKLYEIQLRNQIRTRNEVREDMGLPPVEGGDEFQSQNSVFTSKEAQNSPEKGGEEQDSIINAENEPKSFDFKHKYIKREGSPGNYKYTYPDDQGKNKSQPLNLQQETVSKAKEFFSKEMSFDEFFNNLNYSSKSWKKFEDYIGVADKSEDYAQIKHERNMAFIAAAGPDVKKKINNMLTKFTYDTPDEVVRNSKYSAYMLGEMGAGQRYGDEKSKYRREEMINEITDLLGGDIKEVNKALKYLGYKERIKKGGALRAGAQEKTVDEIKEGLKTITYGDVKYQVSSSYIKNSSSFRSEEELKSTFKEIVDKLPETAKKEINSGKTEVHFTTRPEAKKLSGAISSNRTLGYYLPSNKQIYIFPDKSSSQSFNIKANELLAAGYDQKTVDKMNRITGKESWKHTVTHELAHAVALNNDDRYSQLQEEYNSYMIRKRNDLKKSQEDVAKSLGYDYDGRVKEDFITNYAGTNRKEDFAETFAFYASNKETVDEAIDKKHAWIEMSPTLKYKFEYMRDKIWS